MKKIKQIQQISIQRINKGAHCQFISHILSAIEAYPAVEAKIHTFAEKLRVANEQENGALGVSRKSQVSDKYKMVDAVFNRSFRSYKKYISAFKKFPKKDLSEAAIILEQQLKDYNIRIKDKRANKLGLIVNWVNDLEENYATQVALLNLQTFVAKMKETSSLMYDYHEQRTEELMDYPLGAALSSRQTSEDAYREMVRMVNALAVVEGDEVYSDFIDLANTYIKAYKFHSLKQTASKKATTESEEEQTPSEEV